MTTLIERIKLKEGEERNAQGNHVLYKDHLGKLTIGWGTLIEDGITDAEAELLLKHRLDIAFQTACEFTGANPNVMIASPRLEIITEMAYQMGKPRLFKFTNTRAAYRAGDFEKTADEMLDSKWAREDTPGRAKEASEVMRTGQYQ